MGIGAGTVAAARPSGGPVRRLRALGRAELTLLGRNRSALFVALVLPVLLTCAMRQTTRSLDLSGTGLSPGTVLVPGAIGYALLFAVYSNLLGVYVSRREELVLKRLRTGEVRDAEILAGASLPAVVVGAVQCVVLLGGGALLLHLQAPRQPLLVAAGVISGAVLMVVLAAVSAGFTRTTEAAGITSFPLMIVSLVGSGIVVPLEMLPDRVAEVCAWLPLSPVMELVRGGWTGGADAGEALRALGAALLWMAVAMVCARRWFRWEPRR